MTFKMALVYIGGYLVRKCNGSFSDDTFKLRRPSCGAVGSLLCILWKVVCAFEDLYVSPTTDFLIPFDASFPSLHL